MIREFIFHAFVVKYITNILKKILYEVYLIMKNKKVKRRQLIDMKRIRVFFLFCLMLVLNINLLANDWQFGSEGGHIVPMNMSNISIESEKLHFKLENIKTKEGGMDYGMTVTVKFIFDSLRLGRNILGLLHLRVEMTNGMK